MIRKNRVFNHAGIHRNGFFRGLGMRQAFNEGVANEDMGFFDLGVKKKGRVQ